MEPALSVILAAAIAPLIVVWARRRAVAQPIPAPVNDEAAVLAAVLQDPSRYFKVCVLEPHHFCWAPHRELWKALFPLTEESGDEDQVAEASEAGVAPLVLNMTAEELRAQLESGADEARLALLDELYAAEAPEGDDLLRCGGEVLNAGDERVHLEGAMRLVEDLDGGHDTPLRRDPGTLSRARLAGTALACAAGAAGIWYITGQLGGAHAWMAQCALLCLMFGCAGLSLVDIDTMFIDYPWLLTTVAAAWGFAVPYAVITSGWGRVLGAVIGTAAVVGLLEVLVRGYARVRGKMGMGSGDSALLVATLSVPLMISGNGSVAPAGVLAAALMALAVRAVAYVRDRSSAAAPFAFGPYIAAGWLVGWVLLELV